MTLPLVCSFCWLPCSSLALSAPSVCFFWISALTRVTAALPSADSWNDALRVDERDLRALRERRRRLRRGGAAPACGRRLGRRGAGGGCAGFGCAGVAGAGGGCANTGAALIASIDRASDAAIAEPLITLNPFVSRKPLILHQIDRVADGDLATPVRTSTPRQTGTGTPSAVQVLSSTPVALRVVGEDQPERDVQHRHEEPHLERRSTS